MGINKAGNIQCPFMPTIIPRAFALKNAPTIIGNNYDSHSKPSLIFMDATDFGSMFVVETYNSIPAEIRPEQPLPSKMMADTSWATATVPIGVALIPTVLPIFLDQQLIEGCIHDPDFDDKMEAISPVHLKWAKLYKEYITQQKNDGNNVTIIVNRLSKKSKRVDYASFGTASFPQHSFKTRAFSSLTLS
jgi:hypothetical protein